MFPFVWQPWAPGGVCQGGMFTPLDFGNVLPTVLIILVNLPLKIEIIKKTHLHKLLPERPGIIISLLKSPLHWLKIPEHIHFKVLSLTCNYLQSSQPTYLYELFTIHGIQPTCSTRSSFCLTL